MKSAFAFFFTVVAVLSPVGVGWAEPPVRGVTVVLPQIGETVVFEADALAFSWRVALRDVGAQVGDPDDPRFELSCEMIPPFTVRVLGTYETTVVLRFETAKKEKEAFGCRNGGVVTVSSGSWTTLKKAEAEVAAERAAKERHREKIRGIVDGTAPAGR